MKKLFSILLCMALMVSMVSFSVSAVENDETKVIYTDHGLKPFQYEADLTQTNYQHIVEEAAKIIDNEVEPCAPATITVTDTFTNEIYDSSGVLAVRFRVTVTGIFLTDSLYGEITSVDCKFLYTNNSHYNATTNINGSRASVGINLDNFRLGTYTYRFTDNGNIVQV